MNTRIAVFPVYPSPRIPGLAHIQMLLCLDIKVTRKSSQPKAWGRNLDQGIKHQLLDDKYHSNLCEEVLLPAELGTALADKEL